MKDRYASHNHDIFFAQSLQVLLDIVQQPVSRSGLQTYYTILSDDCALDVTPRHDCEMFR